MSSEAMKLLEGTDRNTKIRDLTARMDALNANNINEDKIHPSASSVQVAL